MDTEGYQALKDEVDELLACDFIKESFYRSWLVNLVLVKKPNDKWRTYVDFINLNKVGQRIAFRFHVSIGSWTRPQETNCLAS